MIPSRRGGVLAVAVATLFAVAGCSEFQLASHLAKKIQRESDSGDELVPKPQYKVGKPYQVAGVWYYPKVEPSYDETGIASWYGAKFHGKRTANGDVFDMNKLTAAHKTLPMPTRVRVTNLENGRSLVLLVNDRGPFAHGRIIDVSRRAAQLLGFQRQGTAKVRVTAVEGGKTVKTVQTTEEERRALPALPRGGITANELPPPPGVKVSSRPAARATAAPVRIANSGDRSPAFSGGSGNGEPVVEIRPVKGDPTMFVQAGAFADATNAVRLRARLSYIGNAKVSTVIVRGRELFRVRIGPLASLRVADQTLKRVLAEGIAGAKIIVD